MITTCVSTQYWLPWLQIEVVEQFGVQVNRVMRQQLEHERLSNIIERIEAYDAVEVPNDECMKVSTLPTSAASRGN